MLTSGFFFYLAVFDKLGTAVVLGGVLAVLIFVTCSHSFRPLAIRSPSNMLLCILHLSLHPFDNLFSCSLLSMMRKKKIPSLVCFLSCSAHADFFMFQNLMSPFFPPSTLVSLENVCYDYVLYISSHSP